MPTCHEHDLCSTERRRCRHCRGCVYFETVSNFGCCNYFLLTGKRRPSRFGLPDCSVREYRPGYVVPDYHKKFCQRVDEQEAQKAQADPNRKKQKYIESLQQCVEWQQEQMKRPGRKPMFDVAYALWLYSTGYYWFEVAEVLSAKQDRLEAYSSDHHWAEMIPPGVQRRRHNINQAKADYQRWKEKQSEAPRLDAQKGLKL